MIGLQFENCNGFGLSIEFVDCTLNHSSFYQNNLKKTCFTNCQLQEVEFSGSDIQESKFDNCDLTRAIFRNSNLERADFRAAFNYSIDPEHNKMKKALFSQGGLSGLLDKYDIEIKD